MELHLRRSSAAARVFFALLASASAVVVPSSGASQQTDTLPASSLAVRRRSDPFVAPGIQQDPTVGARRFGLSTRARWEIGAVAFTGAAHLAFRAMDATAVFVPLASLGWGAYAYHRIRTESDFLGEIGIRSGGLGPSAVMKIRTLSALGQFRSVPLHFCKC